ncbi:MAG: endonuclease/exonuclease/phosphatase family protein [Pseudomonadota bacterium]
MRIVTYNVQYGIGLDGRYDISRVCDAVRDADIICFQEVTRGFIRNAGADMPAQIEEQLPNYFSSFHPATDIDMMSGFVEASAVNRRFQFGNMVLSRWPITAVRGHLLPRTAREDVLNLQRGALEALINTPAGPIRVYSVHLDHISPKERLLQLNALCSIAENYDQTGGAVTGAHEFGLPENDEDMGYLLLGDFNFEPGSDEYVEMTSQGVIDVSAKAPGWSWVEPKDKSKTKRLDHIFASLPLASKCVLPQIDQQATGSDHMPVWIAVNV